MIFLFIWVARNATEWDHYPMYTHSDIWRAIDRLAQGAGYSPSGLAKKAGLDPTTFNKSKRVSADGKPRWPSTESIAKILAVTGATMTDFFGMIDQTAAPAAKSPQVRREEIVRQIEVLQRELQGLDS